MLYLKDMERKLKQIILDWRKAETSEDKRELLKQMQALLFRQKEKQSAEKVAKKINSKYQEIGGEIIPGIKVLMKQNHKVGEVKEVRGKKAIVQLGIIPITIDLDQLVPVKEKAAE
jgi:DNA mismatch repair protein MutS2